MEKEGSENVFLLPFQRGAWDVTNDGSAKVRKHKDTRTKREISYTLLMSVPAPKLLFLITFLCDIICCKIVYA